MQDQEFDLEAFREQVVSKLQAGDGLLSKNGAFTPLLKAFLEQAMEGELDAHLTEEEQRNRKNGKGRKIIRTSLGEVEIATPRDQNGSFQPKVLAKRQKNLPRDLEKQILTLYARGSSLGDIRDFLEEMYDVEVSPSTISRVTDKVIPLLEEWRIRPLELRGAWRRSAKLKRLPLRFYGCNTLQSARGRTGDYQSGLWHNRGQPGRLSRRPRALYWSERVGKVLDASTYRPAEQRLRGHADRFGG